MKETIHSFDHKSFEDEGLFKKTKQNIYFLSAKTDCLYVTKVVFHWIFFKKVSHTAFEDLFQGRIPYFKHDININMTFCFNKSICMGDLTDLGPG